MAYCAFLLMKKLTSLKQTKQQVGILSLPHIKKKSVSVPSSHVSTAKIKIDIKKPLTKLRKSSPLLHMEKRQSQIFNLEELRKKSIADPLSRQDHLSQRKIITLNQETIDLWKLKHHQSVSIKRLELDESYNRSASMQIGLKAKQKGENLSQELPPSFSYRKNSIKQKLNEEKIPEEFSVKKVVYENGSKKKILKIVRDDKQISKQPKKPRVPKQQLLPKKTDISQIPQYNPTKWQTHQKNAFSEEEQDQMFIKEKDEEKEQEEKAQQSFKQVPSPFLHSNDHFS